jgi:uncharacterized protein (DUF4213/DUF364 family)
MLKRILDTVDNLAVITDVNIYLNWVVVKSLDYAMSTLFLDMPGLEKPCGMNTFMGDIIGKKAIEIAEEFLLSKESLKVSVGMACLKSILPHIQVFDEGNAIDRHREEAHTRPTCFIGHFNEAEKWRSEGDPVNIIELFPRPGDIHWNDSHEILAKAELVFLTGLTLVNNTFDEVIRRTPKAKHRIIMGPTVPMSTVLFDFGVDHIGVTLIKDPVATIVYCSRGGGSIAHAPKGALQKVNMFREGGVF